MEAKPATTYREQLDKIVERGCLVEDEDEALFVLKSVNYYRLTAYFLPFRKDDGFYLEGTTFSRIYRIYEFDRELRQILFSVLEEIEISLRARLAYYHAHKYSPLGYLDGKNYSKAHNHKKFLEIFDREVSHNSNVLFVKHHQEKYDGKLPIWAAIELFSFGMVSYFYADLPLCDQKDISKDFGANPKSLKSWLRCATDLRNICAHYGRLYFRIFTAIPANLAAVTERDRRSLWAAFLAVRNLYPNKKKWNEVVLPSVNELFGKYAQNIQLGHVGFPVDWKKYAQKS